MGAESFWTRREGDQLSRRVEQIDQHGPRNMAGLSYQVAQLTSELRRLRRDVDIRFEQHAKQHAKDAQARETGRRWALTAWIAAVATAAAVITMLLAVLAHLP